MPSPFPGMNPFLENDRHWADFHQTYCSALRAALVPQVRPDYLVKLEQHVYIHDLTSEERLLLGRPDVSVAERMPIAASATDKTVALLEPPLEVAMPEASLVERVAYLGIYARDTHEVVTVIELLSPINKRIGPDRETFLAKRRRVLASPAHYIEIDLLRGGPRLPIDGSASCDYYVLLSRAERRPKMGMWALHVRQPLPVIPVPLRPSREDARLDLQALLHEVYDTAGYADYVYATSPQPRLHPDDEAWALQLLHGT